MPLTMENAGIYSGKCLAQMNKILIGPLTGDMTNPQPRHAIDDFDIAKLDASVISEMGYSYNLTVRHIAQNRAVISEHPMGDSFVSIANRALAFRSRALEAGLIDQDMVRVLAGMPVDTN